MIKELQYKGYATEPSDYECPDGQLATSLNLISEDNQLKPVFQPALVLKKLNAGEKVCFVHTTSVFKHYILLRSENRLFWMDSIDTTYWHNMTFSKQVYKVNAVGNTLCLLCDDGMHYFLWKDGKPMNFDASQAPKTQDLPEIYRETNGCFVIRREVFESTNRKVGFKPFLKELSFPETQDVNYPEDFLITDLIYSHYFGE